MGHRTYPTYPTEVALAYDIFQVFTAKKLRSNTRFEMGHASRELNPEYLAAFSDLVIPPHSGEVSHLYDILNLFSETSLFKEQHCDPAGITH